MDRYEYKGAIHVHSTYSDGKGDIEEIMDCANKAGIDFVILTDHDTLQPLDDGHEKWHGSCMLIIGAEITPPDNHYITFGEERIHNISELRKLSPQGYIDQLRKNKWLGFIAHPFFVGAKKFGIGTYKWLDWDIKNFTGMCIWNLLDDWTTQLNREKLSDDVYNSFHKWLTGPHKETMQKFDELSQVQKIVLAGEVDNHKSLVKYENKEFRIFPYDIAFRSITNHLLLTEPLSKDFKTAKRQILNTIAKGNFFVSFDFVHDPTDFIFEVECNGTAAIMGDEIEYASDGEIIISLPDDANISLLRNGEVIQQVSGYELVTELSSPGVYRTTAEKDGLAWIMSNPIYVR